MLVMMMMIMVVRVGTSKDSLQLCAGTKFGVCWQKKYIKSKDANRTADEK